MRGRHARGSTRRAHHISYARGIADRARHLVGRTPQPIRAHLHVRVGARSLVRAHALTRGRAHRLAPARIRARARDLVLTRVRAAHVRTLITPTVVAGATALATLGTTVTDIAASIEAPGGPGARADWTPADKHGFGTSRSTESKVWYTLEGGALTEVYYPDLGTPAARDLQLVVSDGETFTEREREATTHRVERVDRRGLTYRQVNTERSGRWRVTKTYVTDPERSSVLVDVDFVSLTRKPYQVYVLYDPSLTNDGDDDNARTADDALVSDDGRTASALVASPRLKDASNGFLGTSDGWTDLRGDQRMDWHYPRAQNGNVAQTARTALDGVGRRHLTLSLGFGADAGGALATARASLSAGFPAVARAYAKGWQDYLDTLRDPPGSLRTRLERDTYLTSVMVLAAHEDKTYRGAFVASPTMPWAWGADGEPAHPSGPYHLVWPRDAYEIATGMIAAGDRAAAGRALDYMFTRQQRDDGHLPQNTNVDGSPYWTAVPLDETADPIILAWQLGRDDARTWRHVKRAADFILGFETDGHRAPWTQQERWEEQSGYAPATIAAEIAALVCAADLAEANHDDDAARRYLDTADAWQGRVDGWTVTTNGPYSPKPYYLRLTKDGHPNKGTTYDLGNVSRAAVDQRAVVDPSFLELVRLGVKGSHDLAIVNTLKVIDERISVDTPNGQFWHRYSFDGYGEQRDGGPWGVTYPPGSRATTGRLWPLLTGERGEYELAAGGHADGRLAAMAAAANSGGLLSEQVWGGAPPSGRPGSPPGEGTFSATPLAWPHAQFVRLAWSIQAGHPVERPEVVVCRYTGACG